MVNINWSMIFEVLNQSKTESAHLLWECPFARNVWAICQGKLQKCPNEAQDIFMLLRCLLDKLPQQELDRWAVIAWVIWDAQKKFYFEHIQTHPKVILQEQLVICKSIRGRQLLSDLFRVFWLLFGIVCPGVLIFYISVVFLHSGVFLQFFFSRSVGFSAQWCFSAQYSFFYSVIFFVE